MMAWLVVLAVLAQAPSIELSNVLREVGDRAPLVVIGGAEVDVARAQVGVAGAWDDASLSIMGESIPLPGGMSEDPVMIEYRLAQPLNLIGGNLSVLGDRQQRETLIDVGLGDHLAVDDCGRLDDRRHHRAEDFGIFGQLERARAVDGLSRGRRGGLLRDCRGGHGAQCGRAQCARRNHSKT